MALPIRARLTIWYSFALILIVVVIGAFLFVRLRADLTRGLDETLDSRAREISLGLPSGNFEDTADSSLFSSLAKSSDLAQILSAKGTVLQASGDPGNDVPLVSGSILRAASRSAVHRTVAVGSGREPYRVFAAPAGHDVLVVAAPLEAVENATTRLLVLLAFAIPAAVALSALGGYLLARRALGPVDRMTQAAAAIGGADLGARLDVPEINDEVGRLGRTLNAMLERLHRAIEQQRRFAADSSHELRTPLAIMRSELDVALRSPQTSATARPVLESAREEVARMSRIVEDLMTLARIDAGALPIARGPADLTAIARDVCERFAIGAADKQLTMSLEGGEVVAVVDRELLERLLTNLVDNAVKYTPRGGSVDVAVARNGRSARLTVTNSGPVIDPTERAHLFDRFYRVDRARTSGGGAGLGLSICKWIVDAHAGTITVGDAAGLGTSFIVELPLRSASFN